MIGSSLFDEIVAEPDNVALRHVYADWLEQQGEIARATLIRLQCGAEGLPKGPARTEMEREAKALIRVNRAWIPAKRLGKKPVFRGGFLHGITLPAYRFVEVAEELFAVAPLLRAVIFPLPLDEIDGLLACEHTRRLTAADLSQFCECNFCAIDEQVLALFKSPSLANLVTLRTSGDRISADGARVIAECTTLPNLRELDLSENEIGDEGALALHDAPWLGQLTKLDLRKNDIRPVVQRALRKRFGRIVRL